MRIAFILGKFPSLSETFILDQITGLIQRGHSVDIFSETRPTDKIVHEDVKTFKLEEHVSYFKPSQVHKRFLIVLRCISSLAISKPRRFMNLVRSTYLEILHDFTLPMPLKLDIIWDNTKWALLYGFLNQGKKYDVIHCHFGQNGIIGAYLKYWGIPGKLVTSFYGTDLTLYVARKPRAMYSLLFKMGDLFLPICNFFMNILLDLGCNPGKIKIHHLGVDLEVFRPQMLEKREGKGVRILSIGRLVQKKGATYSIKAMKRVVQQFPDASLYIVGDGPERARLESIVQTLRVGGSVKLLGARDRKDIQSLYAGSDIFLLPSVTTPGGDKEGTPTVLLEAQAMQLPVVSTWHAGIPEVVLDGVSGLLVAEKDVEAIASALEELIRSPERRASMGAEGRSIVSSKFNKEKLTDDLLVTYSKLIG